MRNKVSLDLFLSLLIEVMNFWSLLSNDNITANGSVAETLSHLRYDNLWLIENILQNAYPYKRWGSHSSDPDFGRIDTE